MLRSNKGFTLIELLVVLAIISITFSFAILSFGDFGEKRRIIQAAGQFAHDIHVLQQEAILTSQMLGIHITAHGYNMLNFNLSTQRWEKSISKNTLSHTTWPSSMRVQLRTPATQPFLPEIIINTLGDVTPFQLEFGSNTHGVFSHVESTPEGVIVKEVS